MRTMLRVRILGLAAFMALATFSCQKDEDGTPSDAPPAAASSAGTRAQVVDNGFTPTMTAALENMGTQNRNFGLEGQTVAAVEDKRSALPANSSAATAADGTGGQGSPTDASAAAKNALSKLSQAADRSGTDAGSNGGSSAGSSSGSGGSLSSLGDVQTAPAEDASKKAGGLAKDGLSGEGAAGGANGAGLYASGRGSGAGAGGYGSAGFDSDSAVGGGAHGNTVSEIGRDPAASAADAEDGSGVEGMNGHDPDNYFSLVNPSDNLFKVVERRYAKKTQKWALADLGEAKPGVAGSLRK